MTDPNPQAQPARVAPTWAAAALLATGLLAFLWVSDVQGVMFHRAEFELGDYLRPVVTYVLGAALVLWQWDWVARTFASRRFLLVGGGLAATVALASLPDDATMPAGVPALPAGTRETLAEVVHRADEPRSVGWLEPRHVGRPESLAARMGYRERPSAPGLTADLPPGWVELPPNDMRPLNFGVVGQPQVECYVSSLPGTAGGALDNINRWRVEQMGLTAIDAAGLEALPRVRLLGVEAVQVEFEGTFQGRGGDAIAEARLMGVIAALPQVTVFLKMTGPAAALEAERKGFEQVRDTLRVGPADPHGAHPPTPGQGTNGTGANPHAGPATGLRWDVPTGWRESAPRAMRVVTLVPEHAPDVECYVTELPGTAGGLAANVNRWREEQFGVAPLGPEAIAALPTVPMLGAVGTLVEVSGSFTGIGATPRRDYGLLGIVCPLATKVVFVKMIGPRTAVEAERERFLAFCRSLRGE